MKITELYIYPIKSLRPLSVPRARLRKEGPEHDRRFMLLKVEAGGSYRNIQPVHFPESVLFHQEIEDDSVVVTYRDPSEKKKSTPTPELQELQGDATAAALRVPLRPSTESLATVDVRLFGSTTTAYRMGELYDAWFSSRFGYKVILVYIGDHRRPVLAHSPNNNNEKVPRQQRSWLSVIASYVTGGGGEVGEQRRQKQGGEEDFLTFNEAAPFLVTSRASLRDVNSRLPQGEDVDMMVFRPNIVVDDDYDDDNGDGNHCDGGDQNTQTTTERGQQQQQRGGPAQTETQTPASPHPKLEAWNEDFWGELRIGGSHRLALTANCARCLSINIDYDTGRPAEGERGAVLKKLMADRRVDSGNRWSPIFGRYAFLLPTSPASDDGAAAARPETMTQGGGVEADVGVGDEVVVTRRISDRDVWSWPKST